MGVDVGPSVGMSFAMQKDNSQVSEEELVDESVEQETSGQTVDDSGKTLDEINEEIEKELEEAIEQEEQDEVVTLEAEVLKWKEAALRSAADLENFRKRMAREKQDSIRYGNQRLIEELLPVLDNFAMGMQAAEKDSGSMIYMGMQMVQKQLEGFLEGQGVQEVPVIVGSDFDPNLHDAMSQEVSAELEEGKILRVMRKGYKMGDRLVRPANVVVSKGAEESQEEEAAQ
ncbi:molecular chaperone GrpE [Rubritalea squalenifaciens DSM 18772]|uniref:Protein GrpE n=4 Tax=Rubritalea TaxID=361050 RepID=A0A1M6EFH9_9BACT|nr:molecular chaperone GrpE [Rubritalea squalenifaciens DSM 18772]